MRGPKQGCQEMFEEMPLGRVCWITPKICLFSLPPQGRHDMLRLKHAAKSRDYLCLAPTGYQPGQGRIACGIIKLKLALDDLKTSRFFAWLFLAGSSGGFDSFRQERNCKVVGVFLVLKAGSIIRACRCMVPIPNSMLAALVI